MRITATILLCAVTLSGATLSRAGAQAPADAPTLFRNARVFDGYKVLAGTDVLVDNGRIAKIGRALQLPAGAVLVDATGKTLLPGLIDAHTHVWGDALREAVMFGVTTELDMFSDAAAARAMRAEQSAGKADGRADLFSAGTLVTAPKGHGSEYMPIPTITNPDSAQVFVDARIAEGSDYIKIIYDDGRTYALPWPTISRATLRAVIAAAHKRGKLAVVHVGAASFARDALEDGADGLVHLFTDSVAPGIAALAKSKGAFIVPTLVVLKSITGTPGGAPLIDDARMAPYLTANTRMMLSSAFPISKAAPPKSYDVARATVRSLRAAGVPILAGTDASNPGTAHGAAMHRELELLVEAGLTPIEALASATTVAAKAFRLNDRGRIAVGARADLLLVNGDPTAEIMTTRAIAGVWKRGVQIDRAAFAQAVKAEANKILAAPAAMATGDISDFEDGTLAPRFGTTWIESVDSYAGGKSTTKLQIVDNGAAGSGKSLRMTGEISDAVAYAWAGAVWSPGAQVFGPANLSSKKELRFWAKGDGRKYQVVIFAQSRGMEALIQPFTAGPEWKEIVMKWSDFGTDGKDIMAITIAAGPAPGPYAFQIDQVMIR